MNIKLFTPLFFGLFLSSCGTFTKLEVKEVEVSQTIPLHIGNPEFGKYGLYDYSVYNDSVSLRSGSPDITIGLAEVHDCDENGKFDSVWILGNKGWKYFSTLKSSYPNTASISTFQGYVSLANHIKRLVKERKERIKKEQRKIKEDPNFQSQIQLHNFFQGNIGDDYYRP